MRREVTYLMENREEAIRLEVKTNRQDVIEEALWCGIAPGTRVLDAGCGPGKTTSILLEMMQPNGSIVGVDYSEERIKYARDHYGEGCDIAFHVRDLRENLSDLGQFDLIWVRFVLEYNRSESLDIVKNLTECLNPEGCLCLLDLDYNCLTHYEMTPHFEDILKKVMARMDAEFNFDTYAGRKLYQYLYDVGYRDINVHLKAHHLIYGKIREEDAFNWIKKAEVASEKLSDVFDTYPGGHEIFIDDFKRLLLDPRRFTYTPLIMCSGMKPL